MLANREHPALIDQESRPRGIEFAPDFLLGKWRSESANARFFLLGILNALEWYFHFTAVCLRAYRNFQETLELIFFDNRCMGLMLMARLDKGFHHPFSNRRIVRQTFGDHGAFGKVRFHIFDAASMPAIFDNGLPIGRFGFFPFGGIKSNYPHIEFV